MSITTAMYSGVTGLLANAEGINVIGNNLSNTNTVGFKSGRILFSDMLSVSSANNSQIGRGTQIQKIDNIYAQGAFENTEVVSDLALQGNSFFALSDPTVTTQLATQADAKLTRAGSFRVDVDHYLVNPDGYHVLDATGTPIQFPYTDGTTAGDFVNITAVDSRGVITYADPSGNTYFYDGGAGTRTPTSSTTATAIANSQHGIGIVIPTNPQGLNKLGGTVFQVTTESGVPTTAFSAGNELNGTTERAYSNSLELSNVDMAAQFVKMILTQRAYSANSKTITTADEMTQEVLNLKR